MFPTKPSVAVLMRTPRPTRSRAVASETAPQTTQTVPNLPKCVANVLNQITRAADAVNEGIASARTSRPPPWMVRTPWATRSRMVPWGPKAIDTHSRLLYSLATQSEVKPGCSNPSTKCSEQSRPSSIADFESPLVYCSSVARLNASVKSGK